MFQAGPLQKITVADFDRLFAVNVRALFFLVPQLLPALGDRSSVVLACSLAAGDRQARDSATWMRTRAPEPR